MWVSERHIRARPHAEQHGITIRGLKQVLLSALEHLMSSLAQCLPSKTHQTLLLTQKCRFTKELKGFILISFPRFVQGKAWQRLGRVHTISISVPLPVLILLLLSRRIFNRKVAPSVMRGGNCQWKQRCMPAHAMKLQGHRPAPREQHTFTGPL